MPHGKQGRGGGRGCALRMISGGQELSLPRTQSMAPLNFLLRVNLFIKS
ncbi:hypothetical protein CCP2SC5_1600005 [Azospirillaceae bacterium]